MSNRIQELIVFLENEMDRSPKQRLSGGNKRVVDCDKMLDLLGDLKVVIPEEIRLAQTILSEREAILGDAQGKAAAIVANARLEAERLIANDTTMAEAKQRASEIVASASIEADELSQSSRDYSQTIMEQVQRYLTHYIELIDGARDDLRRNYQSSSSNIEKENENFEFGSTPEEESSYVADDIIDTLKNIGKDELDDSDSSN